MPEAPTDTLPETEPIPVEPKKSTVGFSLRVIFCIGLITLLGGFISGWLIYTLNLPSDDFPVNEPITIALGTPVRAIAEQLKAQGVVNSEQLLYYVLVFFHEPSDLKASTYVFDEPLDTLAVARRLTEGDFDTDLVRFTHIEGETVVALADRAKRVLPAFDTAEFVAQASQYEGKLYPETYFVPITFTASELIRLMQETYTLKTEPLQSQIAQSEFTEAEILILASILEREANSPESMGIVSGILQNRLAINMPLQADATIEYVLETPLGELPPGQLAAELRELDSPYNSYLNLGLPPTPIGNPGLTAIKAVLNPVETDYFYYVTDADGAFYYAETYDQHLQNIERYLR